METDIARGGVTGAHFWTNSFYCENGRFKLQCKPIFTCLKRAAATSLQALQGLENCTFYKPQLPQHVFTLLQGVINLNKVPIPSQCGTLGRYACSILGARGFLKKYSEISMTRFPSETKKKKVFENRNIQIRAKTP